MRRFKLHVAIGWIVLLASTAAWAHSYVTGTSILWFFRCTAAQDRAIELDSNAGTLGIDIAAYPSEVDRQRLHMEHFKPEGIGGSPWQRFGFEMDVLDRYVQFPYWLPGLAAAVSLLIGSIRDRQARRRKQMDQVCIKCGYDLRASVGRCPECGMGIEPLAAPRQVSAKPI